MAETRLAKIVTGEIVMGIDAPELGGIKDVANVQIIPSGGGMQLALLPFGFPFEEDIKGFIANDKVIYEIEKIPSELIDKYTEAKSNIRIAKTGGSGDGGIIL